MAEALHGKPLVVSLDGGPCAGKSSVLAGLQESGFGHPAIFIPEVASGYADELLARGTTYSDLAVYDRPAYLDYQRRIIGTYMESIDTSRAQLQDTGGVIVTDRGIAGIRAYVHTREWFGLLKEFDTTPDEVVTQYADAVIFLASLAITNPAKYQAERMSNPIRTESVKGARDLHRISRACWITHSNLIEVGGDDVAEKTRVVRSHIGRLLAGNADLP